MVETELEYQLDSEGIGLMELIDQYLSAVAGHLPGDTRDDIKAELRSSLYEQLEDQSKTLQRELTEEEQVEFLRKLGRPLKVAARYLPQQYLIGPGLFPFYFKAMKTTAVLVIMFHIAVSVVSALVTDNWIGPVSTFMARIIQSMLVVGAIVTIVFTVMERSGDGANRFNRWDPLSLRKRGLVTVSKSDMITDVSAETVLLLWWNGVFNLGDWISWNGATLSVATPGWDAVFWPVNIVLGGSLLLHGVMLMVTHWRPGLVAMEILIDLATIGIMGYLIRYPGPIRVDISADVPLDALQTGVTFGFQILAWFILVMAGVELIKHIRIAFRLQESNE